MKILALAICDTRQKKIHYLDISLLAAGPLITVSLIIYPQERNMTIAGYRLSMCEAGVLGSLWQFLSRRPQISIFVVLG